MNPGIVLSLGTYILTQYRRILLACEYWNQWECEHHEYDHVVETKLSLHQVWNKKAIIYSIHVNFHYIFTSSFRQ